MLALDGLPSPSRSKLLWRLMPVTLLLGCQGNAGLLSIDLRTDLVPIVEFEGARISLDEDRVGEHLVQDLNYLPGVQIATFDAVVPGRHELRVELLARSTTLLSRTYILEVAPGDSGMTLLMTRDCRHFACPEGQSCQNATCISPNCEVTESNDCGLEPLCESAADCPAAHACAQPLCTGGACFQEDKGECAAGEYCDPELGCRPQPPTLQPPCAIEGAPVWSNLSEAFTGEEGSAQIVVGSEGFPVWVFDSADGSIVAYESASASSMSRVVRPGTLGLDAGSGVYFERLVREDQPEGLGFFALSSLEVPLGTRLIGVGPRPLMILARTEILVGGLMTVAASAWNNRPGAGGGRGTVLVGEGPGGGGVGGATVDTHYGGGASFGGLGSAAGFDSDDSSLAQAGSTYANSALRPLMAGSGGGGPGRDSNARGGHGGGALQLMAYERIIVQRLGVLDASGGGGLTGHDQPYGGGGSGGALLLEAPLVDNLGLIGANGGAGAGGYNGRGESNGQDGSATLTPARGGGSVRIGRNGSDAMGQPDLPSGISGAGGGGAGRIRINSLVADDSFGPGFLPAVESQMVSFGRLGQCL